jgi:O-antigen ligase
MLAAFAFGLRAGLASVILIRPLTDRLFELSSINIAGHDFTYGVVLNALLILVAIINVFRIRRCIPSGLRTAWLPFLAICAISILYSPIPIDALRKLSIYLCYYSIFILSFAVARSERDALFLLRLVVVSSVLPVLYGLFETLFGADLFEDSRAQSTFSHPNMLAFYLVAVVGVILFLTSSERIRMTGRLRLCLNLYLIPLLIVLILTQTRSAWIGCLMLFIMHGLIHRRRLLFFMLIVAPLLLAIPAVNERIIDLTSNNEYIGGPAVVLNSFAWRKLLWENAFSYIWQAPIFGHGLHSFFFYSREFFSPAPNGTYAHNDYLQILFETGLVGIIAFLWMFCRYFVWLLYRWRADKAGAAAAVAILLGYLICSYSDNLLEYLPYQLEFWFPLGLIFWHMEREYLRAADRRFVTSRLGEPRGLSPALR